jgi:hypothetical protein
MVLSRLGIPVEMINFFRSICKGKWFVPKHLRRYYPNSFVQWKRGQPLGLYPSFAVFAMSHGFFVRSIEIKYKKKDTFRILGDDIVINDEDVYNDYLQYLKVLQIPVSEQKSIVSKSVGEFAGQIVTKKNVLSCAKWRKPNSLNKISLLTSLPRAMDGTIRDEFISQIIRSTPLGSGENPEGLSLKSRIPFYFDFYEDEEVREITLSSEERMYYESKFCKDFNTLPLLKRADVEDFIMSVINSPNWRQTNEIYKQVTSPGVSQDTVQELWSYLLETFRFPSLKVPEELFDRITRGKNYHGYLRSILDSNYKDSMKSPVEYFRRRFAKSAIRWHNVPEHMKEQLLQIITSKIISKRR